MKRLLVLLAVGCLLENAYAIVELHSGTFDDSYLGVVTLYTYGQCQMVSGTVTNDIQVQSGVLDIYGGSIPGQLITRDSSVLNLYDVDGAADPLILIPGGGGSTMNLYGGLIDGNRHMILASTTDGIVNIYGGNFNFDLTGGYHSNGLITGNWESGESFRFHLHADTEFSHINLVPEPATLLLLGLGVVMLRKKRQ